MNPTIESKLKSDLEPNEKLLWTGQPKAGIVFRTADIFLIPFSILWCGFAIFWFWTAITSDGPIFFALFGVPFVMIGLMFVFGRFIMDIKQREHTYYGISAHRIIIKTGIYKQSIKSVQLNTLSELEYTENKDGVGTIMIGPKIAMNPWGNGMNWWPGMRTSPSFDYIPDVKNVYNQLITLQRAAKP